MPADTNFPMPCDGQVARRLQKIVTGLPAISAHVQYEAKFVPHIVADWMKLETDLQFANWQRYLNVRVGCTLWLGYSYTRGLHLWVSSGGRLLPGRDAAYPSQTQLKRHCRYRE